MPNHKMPAGANIHLAAGIKQAVNAAGFQLPVIGTGKINTWELAESILRDGKADLIGMARAHLWILSGLAKSVTRPMTRYAGAITKTSANCFAINGTSK